MGLEPPLCLEPVGFSLCCGTTESPSRSHGAPALWMALPRHPWHIMQAPASSKRQGLRHWDTQCCIRACGWLPPVAV